jgi:hypothetical protein
MIKSNETFFQVVPPQTSGTSEATSPAATPEQRTAQARTP